MKKVLSCLLLAVFMAPFVARANEAVVGDVRMDEVMIEDFETGDFNNLSWDNTVSDYPWEISTTNPYEGTYSMKSACEGINEGISTIQITVDVPQDCAISFYVRISSENRWDNGYFYIDGAYMESYTGELAWVERKFNIEAGSHTFAWEYMKDYITSFGEDAMYIDYINFADEPVVVDPGLLFYDNDLPITSVGNENGDPIWWGVMFPASMMSEHEGESLTKVMAHGYSYSHVTGDYSTEGDYTLNIHYGGEDAPGTLVHSQEFHMTGDIQWNEIELTTPLSIDPTQNLWVILYTNSATGPMTYSADCGNPNARWCSRDGITWFDILAEYSVPCTWMIRAYVAEDTGVGEFLSDNTSVYPNPTRGDLKIETEGMNRITVTSVLGQVVMDKVVASDCETIDMSQLESGIYMVQIVSESGITVKRVNVVK